MPYVDKSAPRSRFGEQRRAAKRRGISWQLSFDEWWSIWTASGKYAQRGCGTGKYVMSRRGDAGPYSADNVFISSFEANVSEGHDKLGTGRGWTFVAKSKRNPFQVCVAHKYIGCYSTAAEAEEAYRNACL